MELIKKEQPIGVFLATGIMQLGSLMIIFYALSTLTTGILQGLDQLRAPLINCAISLVLHIILLYVLLTKANLNIYAVVWANIFFSVVVCILNAIAIRRTIQYRQETFRTFIVPAIASIIMAAAAYIVHAAFSRFLGNTIATVLAILAGVLVYGIGLVSFRGISIEEIAALPKGHAIIKLLRKTGLIR